MAKVEVNGKWAMVRETPLTWGERNKVTDAFQRARSGGGFMESLGYVLVTTYVTEWSEDSDPSKRVSWERLTDPDFGDVVFAECLRVWRNRGEVSDDEDAADPIEASSAT